MKKRMLSIERIGGKNKVYCNSSSLSLIQECPTKSRLSLALGLLGSGESPAQTWGKAIHKALERFYIVPPDSRTQADIEESISLFRKEAESLEVLGRDRNGVDNGVQALSAYFSTYKNDPWVLLTDVAGKPMAELDLQATLYKSNELDIVWFGTIDAIMQNVETGEIAVVDHKTSASLGKEFSSRWNPNHQITGYLFLAKSHGIITNRAMINGIGKALTKKESIRLFTERNDQDLSEFTETVKFHVGNYLQLLGSLGEYAEWPKAGGMVCSSMGGCRFLDFCSLPGGVRNRALESIKQKGVENGEID